ncbi:MAG: hypothetical protein RI897_3566 [Verrucomicrobiota bacterium]
MAAVIAVFLGDEAGFIFNADGGAEAFALAFTCGDIGVLESDGVIGFVEDGLEREVDGLFRGVADVVPGDDDLAVGCGADCAVEDGSAGIGAEGVPIGGEDGVGGAGVGEVGVGAGGEVIGEEAEESVGADVELGIGLAVEREIEGEREGGADGVVIEAEVGHAGVVDPIVGGGGHGVIGDDGDGAGFGAGGAAGVFDCERSGVVTGESVGVGGILFRAIG